MNSLYKLGNTLPDNYKFRGMRGLEPPIAYTGVVKGYMVESALYCEYKPYLDALREDRVSPGIARRIAKRALDLASNVTKVGSGYVRIIITGRLFNYPVIVSPDAIYFEHGRPRAILRARIRRSLRPHPGDWAILYLAGLLLRESFDQLKDVDLLLVLILAVDERVLSKTLSRIKYMKPRPFNGEGVKAITRIFDEDEALSLVSRPLKIITGEQHPRPPPPSKCMACAYRENCPFKVF